MELKLNFFVQNYNSNMNLFESTSCTVKCIIIINIIKYDIHISIKKVVDI